jgi:Na+/H+-dicarboxylate symporter
MTHSSQADQKLIWQRIPLYVQILIAIVVAVSLGTALGLLNPRPDDLITHFAIPCTLVLKALRMLATPLILLAVLQAFMTTQIPGRSGRRLAGLLLTNTVVSIGIGLIVANLFRPGSWAPLGLPGGTTPSTKTLDPWGLLQDSIPGSIVQPLVDNNVIQLIFLALAFGIGLRALKTQQIEQGQQEYVVIEQAIAVLFATVIRVLHWVIALVPLAVFGIVAKTVALQGFAPFKSLAAFIVAVLIALGLQAGYYLCRVRWGSWVRPQRLLSDGSDALWTAFSTASSTVTMPITFRVLREKVGLRASSTSLGALVGSNFNNDSTALYEAMSALFVAQLLGLQLSLPQQFIVVLTSIVASVGAAGIPEAGLVTMTLVFTAVGLPTQYIALLVTVDWFLDRCRTAINVMGDMTVSCLLDGNQQEHELDSPAGKPMEQGQRVEQLGARSINR